MHRVPALATLPSWLLWTALTLFSWGVWGVMFKLLGDALNAEQSQALSTLGFLPVVLPLVWIHGRNLRSASRRGMLLALAGGVVSCLGNIPYYAALGRGEKFATVISLVAMAPLVTVLLALIFLRERLSPPQVCGLVLALAAIWLLNIASGAGLLSSAVLVALPPIVLWGLSGFLQKISTNHVSGDLSAAVYLAAFLPMGAYYGVTQPWPAGLAPRAWIVVLALGFFLAFGNYAVIKAYARGGQASVVAPMVNLFPVLSIGLAILFLDETIGRRELAGIACALASVALLSLEAKKTA